MARSHRARPPAHARPERSVSRNVYPFAWVWGWADRGVAWSARRVAVRRAAREASGPPARPRYAVKYSGFARWRGCGGHAAGAASARAGAAWGRGFGVDSR